MQTRSNRSRRTLQQFGRVSIAHLLQVTETDNLAILLRKRKNCSLKILDQLSLAQLGKNVLLVRRIVCKYAFAFFVELFNQRDVAATLLHNTSGQVTSNAEEISCQRSLVGVESLWAPNQQHENFLSNVFGGGSITAHMVGKTIERPLISVVDGAEGLFIAAGNQSQQRVVAVCCICSGCFPGQ